MYTTSAADVAQQHHLAWLLGYVCGVRPGSIGHAKLRDEQYLQWKDITITRMGPPESFNFQAKVQFRWLKGWTDNTRRTLTFTCSGPRHVEDVMYSIPHHLVAMALRRDLLEDYKDLSQLFGDSQRLIKFKESAKELPVVCKVESKGLAIIPDEAASSLALSQYVQRRAMDYGLPAGITHYAWRRSAGTKMARAMGAEAAREFLAHDPASKTFERAYNQGTIALDAMSIAMDRQALPADVVLEDELVVARRIRQATTNREAWIEKYVLDNDDYQTQKDKLDAAEREAALDPDNEEKQESAEAEHRTLRLYRRSLQNQGRLAFQELQHKFLDETLTQEELEERIRDAKSPGLIQKMLLDAAKAAREQADQTELDEFDNPGAEEEYGDEDLQDVRDRLDDAAVQDGQEVPVQTVSFHSESAQQSRTVDWVAIAASCKTLLEILVGQTDLVHEEVPCRKCQADPYVSDTDKAKTYQRGRLNQHLGTDFHSPKSTYFRRFQKGSKNQCPYANCGFTGTGPQIARHCHTQEGQSDEHLKAAAKDGLFARDFDPRTTKFSTTKTRVKDGQVQKVEEDDPEDVPMGALIPPRNLSKTGELREAEKAGRVKNEPTLRLPTRDVLTNTGWWKEHDDGIYGAVTDTLQAQQRWLMTHADSNLRELGVGQASEHGETRKLPHKSERRAKGIKALRKRLADMGWRWAEDEDDVVLPDEEDEEEEGAAAEEAEREGEEEAEFEGFDD